MKVITAPLLLLSTIGIFAFTLYPATTVPYTKEMLGNKLFSEKILSKDSTVSCASCHKPQYAFADTMAFSNGIEGKFTKRNTPSVLNMKNRPYFFGMAEQKHLKNKR